MLIALFVCGSLALGDDGAEDRLIGAAPSAVGQFRYQAQISMVRGKPVYLCSGAIISKRFVLTTAKCVNFYEPVNFTVHTGSIDLLQGTKYPVSRVITHPKFGGYQGQNNIGLIQTQRDIQFTALVAAARLPTSPLNADAKINVTSSGWGTSTVSSISFAYN